MTTQAEVALVVEESDSWMATKEALSSPPFLEHFAKGGEGWWFDVRRQRMMLGGRAIGDEDEVAFKAWCAANVLKRRDAKTFQPLVPSVQAIHEVVVLLAHADRRDDVAEYLEGLRGGWDGTTRLTTELPRALGLEAPEPYEATWVRKWLIGAAARAMRPGCKMDTALLLIGNQGIGKSTSIGVLFGEGRVHDSALDLESKDGASIMSRAWCVELAELASMRRAKDVEAVKHFLSLREDTFRPPYGRLAVTTPRRAVVCGTSNDAAPLTDPTGNRRFWPVRVTARADLQWLEQHRDAVWAEALSALEAGEPWHLDADEAEVQRTVAESFAQGDEWAEGLRSWAEALGENEGVTLSQAATVLGFEDLRQLDMSTQRRLGVVLRQMGFERRHARGGKRWFRGVPRE